MINNITSTLKYSTRKTVGLSKVWSSGVPLSRIYTHNRARIKMIERAVLRKQAKEAAVNRLVKTKVGIYREELKASIYFTVTGIKECANQPFSNFEAKLHLIQEGLEDALRAAKHVGFTKKQTHPKAHIVGYHFFETEIAGRKAYFNVQLTVQNDLILYSITDKYSL